MDLKKELKELLAMSKSGETSDLMVVSKMMAMTAALQDPATQVPADIFEGLEEEVRRIILQSFLLRPGPSRCQMSQPLLTPDQFSAENYLCQEMANAAKPFIRAALLPHAFNWAADRPAKFSWLRGIWLEGRRGMILTADDVSVLWAGVEPPPPQAAPVLDFKLHLLELARRSPG